MVGLLRLSRMEPRYRCDRDASKAGRFSVVAIFSELDDTTLCNDKVRKYTIMCNTLAKCVAHGASFVSCLTCGSIMIFTRRPDRDACII